MKFISNNCLLFAAVVVVLLVSSGSAANLRPKGANFLLGKTDKENNAIFEVLKRVLSSKQEAKQPILQKQEASPNGAAKKWQWLRLKTRSVDTFKNKPFQFLLHIMKERFRHVLEPRQEKIRKEAGKECTSDMSKKVYLEYNSGAPLAWWDSVLHGCEPSSWCTTNLRPYQIKGRAEKMCVEVQGKKYREQRKRMETISRGVEEARDALKKGLEQRKAEHKLFVATIKGHDDAVHVLEKIMGVLSRGESPALLEAESQMLSHVKATSVLPTMLLEMNSSEEESKLDKLKKFCNLLKKNLEDSTKYMKAEEDAQAAEWENVRKQNVLTISRGPDALAEAEYLRDEAKSNREKCQTRLAHAKEGFSTISKTCIDNHAIFVEASQEYKKEAGTVSHVGEVSKAEGETQVNVPEETENAKDESSATGVTISVKEIRDATGTETSATGVEASSGTGVQATSKSVYDATAAEILGASGVDMSSNAVIDATGGKAFATGVETMSATGVRASPSSTGAEVSPKAVEESTEAQVYPAPIKGSSATGVETPRKSTDEATGLDATGVDKAASVPETSIESSAATAVEIKDSTGAETGIQSSAATAVEIKDSTGAETGIENSAATAVEIKDSTGAETGIENSAATAVEIKDSTGAETIAEAPLVSPSPVIHVPSNLDSPPKRSELLPVPVPSEKEDAKPKGEAPLMCPQPKCQAPADGCQRVMSSEKNEMGCPKYPCGVETCDGKSSNNDSDFFPSKPEIPPIPSEDDPIEEPEDASLPFENTEKEVAWIKYKNRKNTAGLGRKDWGILYERLKNAREVKREKEEERKTLAEEMAKKNLLAKRNAQKEEDMKSKLEKENAASEAEEERKEKERLAAKEEDLKRTKTVAEEKEKKASQLEKEENAKQMEKEKKAEQMEEIQKGDALRARNEEQSKKHAADVLRKAAAESNKKKQEVKAAEEKLKSQVKMAEQKSKNEQQLKRKEENERTELKRKEEHEKKELKQKEENEKKQKFAEMMAKQKQHNAIKEANEKKILKANEATSKREKEEQEKKIARQNAEKAAEEIAKIREKSQQLHSGERLQEGQLMAEAIVNSKKAVDCVVEWSEYTKCSKTCGGGTQKRTVKKVKQNPLHGGKVCPKEEVRDCNTKACSIAQRIMTRGRSVINRFIRI